MSSKWPFMFLYATFAKNKPFSHALEIWWVVQSNSGIVLENANSVQCHDYTNMCSACRNVLTVWQSLFVDNGENQNNNTYKMLVNGI